MSLLYPLRKSREITKGKEARIFGQLFNIGLIIVFVFLFYGIAPFIAAFLVNIVIKLPILSVAALYVISSFIFTVGIIFCCIQYWGIKYEQNEAVSISLKHFFGKRSLNFL